MNHGWRRTGRACALSAFCILHSAWVVPAGCHNPRSDAPTATPTVIDLIPGVASLEVENPYVRLRKDDAPSAAGVYLTVGDVGYLAVELRRGDSFSIRRDDRTEEYEILTIERDSLVLKQTTIGAAEEDGTGARVTTRVVRVAQYKPRTSASHPQVSP